MMIRKVRFGSTTAAVARGRTSIRSSMIASRQDPGISFSGSTVSLNQQIQSERHNGDRPQLVVSGYVHISQHQWWCDLDQHLALDAISEHELRDCLSAGHLDVTVAQISCRASMRRRRTAWAGGKSKNRLDDGRACHRSV